MRPSGCRMSGKKDFENNFEWLWRAEHAANTAIRESVSTVALRVCACLPAYLLERKKGTINETKKAKQKIKLSKTLGGVEPRM